MAGVSCNRPDYRHKCKICGDMRYAKSGTALCETHYRIYNREQMARMRVKHGRHGYSMACLACGNKYHATIKDKEFCPHCRFYSKAPTDSTYEYIAAHGFHKWPKHRVIVEELLGIELLPPLLHIHHLDCNGKNNVPSNFVILHRNLHAKLHRYLDKKYLACIVEHGKWYEVLVEVTESWLAQVDHVRIADITPDF